MSAATLRKLRRQEIRLAEFDIGRNHARPFGAGAEEPALLADNARGVNGVARNQKLHAVAGAQIRPDDDVLALPAQQQHLDRIAKVIMIELVIADPVQPHRRLRRHHEIQRRPQRAAVSERRRQSARRDLLLRSIGFRTKPQVAFGSSSSNFRTSSAVMSLIIALPVPPAVSAAAALTVAGMLEPSKAPHAHAARCRNRRRPEPPPSICCRTDRLRHRLCGSVAWKQQMSKPRCRGFASRPMVGLTDLLQ